LETPLKFLPSHAKVIDTPTSSDAIGVGQLGLSHEVGLRMSGLLPSPLVAGDAFRTVCLALAESYRRVGVEARWTPTSVRLPTSFFNVKDDGYLLVRNSSSSYQDDHRREIRTNYHVLFSKTWQLPVLYFAAMWEDTLEPLTMNEVYTYLVEKSSEDALKDVGIMGGISHGVRTILLHS
jgi:hypothetical protein